MQINTTCKVYDSINQIHTNPHAPQVHTGSGGQTMTMPRKGATLEHIYICTFKVCWELEVAGDVSGDLPVRPRLAHRLARA